MERFHVAQQASAAEAAPVHVSTSFPSLNFHDL